MGNTKIKQTSARGKHYSLFLGSGKQRSGLGSAWNSGPTLKAGGRDPGSGETWRGWKPSPASVYPAANPRSCVRVTELGSLLLSTCVLGFCSLPGWGLGTRRCCCRSCDVHGASLTGTWPWQACRDPRPGGPGLGLNLCVLRSPCEILGFRTGGTAFSFCSGPHSCMAAPGFLLVL